MFKSPKPSNKTKVDITKVPKISESKDKPASSNTLFILTHSVYICIISMLLFLVYSKNKELNNLSTAKTSKYLFQHHAEKLSKADYDFEFKNSSDENASYFDIPPELFDNPLLKVWKWKSPLTPSQCDSAWKAAEELNDYGEYSKFGSEFPTLDVSLDKLPPRMAPMFNNLIEGLGKFITEKFLVKTPIDGDEMTYSNGTKYFDTTQDYMRFLQLKGTPFIIKYDAGRGKLSKLRTHKDNSEVSFILLINKPTDFGDGGTYFHAINKTLYMEQGEALIFNGQLVHEAVPISSGKRFVISGFILFNEEYKKMKRLGTLTTTPLLF